MVGGGGGAGQRTKGGATSEGVLGVAGTRRSADTPPQGDAAADTMTGFEGVTLCCPPCSLRKLSQIVRMEN